jgi:hypothetical protein
LKTGFDLEIDKLLDDHLEFLLKAQLECLC